MADFPLMNLNDLITVTMFLSSIDVSKLPDSNKDDFLWESHIYKFSYTITMLAYQ